MKTNFNRNKRNIEEAKRKRQQEKRDKKLAKKLADAAPAATPEQQIPPTENAQPLE